MTENQIVAGALTSRGAVLLARQLATQTAGRSGAIFSCIFRSSAITPTSDRACSTRATSSSYLSFVGIGLFLTIAFLIRTAGDNRI